MGSKNDSRVSWNEKEDWAEIIELNSYREIEVIQRTYIAENDWEDEKNTIDLDIFEKLVAKTENNKLEKK